MHPREKDPLLTGNDKTLIHSHLNSSIQSIYNINSPCNQEALVKIFWLEDGQTRSGPGILLSTIFQRPRATTILLLLCVLIFIHNMLISITITF